MNPVIIFGAGPLGLAAYEIFRSNGAEVFGFLDDDAKLHGTEMGEATVLGDTDDEKYLKLIGQKCDAFIAIDDARLRKSLAKMLNERRHVQPVTAVHASATVAQTAVLHYGAFIGAGAIVAAGVQIGNHCLIHSGAIVEYGAKLGDNVQIGTGAIVGAQAELADDAFIGPGALIVPGLAIGKAARVGAGSVVVEALPAKATVFGNPAKAI